MATRTSAGILLYRIGPAGLEVLLAHPGGPFFANRDDDVWSIPKGEPNHVAEPLLRVAEREFAEETGHSVPDGPRLELGSIVQKGGKVVHAWAVRGDLDPTAAISNTFELEWPPHSGTWRVYPEIDVVEWFDPTEARPRIKAAQMPFIDRLAAALEDSPGEDAPGEATPDDG